MVNIETKRVRAMELVNKALAEAGYEPVEEQNGKVVLDERGYDLDALIEMCGPRFSAKKVAEILASDLISYYREKAAKEETEAEDVEDLLKASREEVVEELKKRGYDAKECQVCKNGKALTVISEALGNRVSVNFPMINQTIEKMVESGKWNVNDIVVPLMKVIQDAMESGEPDDVVQMLLDKEAALKNLKIFLEPEPEIPCEGTPVKEGPFEKTVQYLCFIEGERRVKVSEALLTSWNVTEEEAWEIAMENIRKDFTIETMSSVIAKMPGIPAFMLPPQLDEDEEMMFIIGQKNSAADALNIDFLKEKFAKRTDKIAIIPSSIYECIVIVPREIGMDEDDINQMIQEVNENQLDEFERLAEKALIVDLTEAGTVAPKQSASV